MAFQHVRNPNRLDDSSYGEFCYKVRDFLLDSSSLPHRPTHLMPLQSSAADEFNLKLDAFKVAETNMRIASRNVSDGANDLRNKLQWFKYILPTVILGEDNILQEFGLNKILPRGNAEIKDLADKVWSIWQVRSIEQQFAPIKSEGDLLGSQIGAYNMLLSAQNSAQNNLSRCSNEKKSARDAHNKIEREIFSWYRAYYRKPTDDYWAQTPWGKSSPDSGSQPVPPTPRSLIYDSGSLRLKWEPIKSADFYRIEHRMEGEATYKLIASASTNQWILNAPFLGSNEFRVRGVVNGTDTEPTLPVKVGIGALGEIKNFRYDTVDRKLKWDLVPGATMYLILENGEDIGEIFHTNEVSFLPLPDMEQKVKVFGTNGMQSTLWSDEIIIYPEP